MKPIRKLFKALAVSIRENPDQFLNQRGSMAIEVGEGDVLTVRFGDHERPIEEAFDQDADLLVWFSESAFDAFLDGSLDPGSALENESLVLGGEIQLFGTLGLVLQPSKSWLSIRGG